MPNQTLSSKVGSQRLSSTHTVRGKKIYNYFNIKHIL